MLKQRRRRRQRERQKNKQLSLANQQLCTCITPFCTIGNLRTTTTAWSTTTGSELHCNAQARPVNFVVVVSSTTPNKVESRRPVIHKLRQVYYDVKMPQISRFMEDVNTRRQFSFSSPELQDSPLEFSYRKIGHYLPN